MGLFGDLIKTGLDIVTTPLDIIADVADTMDGYKPKNTTNKIKKVAQGGADIVKDAVNLDL